MAYQYPEAPATVGSDLTTLQVHHLMKSPALLVKRAADLARQKFIADFLLTGRYQAVGGAILYETGEEIFPADVAEKIAPGGEYPRTTMTSGELAAAKVEKWGQDSSVTDEAISRLNVSPVDKALRKVVNGMIRQGDGAALGVIASQVTQSEAASATWTGASAADAIVDTVLSVQAKYEEVNDDYSFSYDTVVLKPTQFAKIAAAFVKSNLVPRESQNFVLNGVIPDYLGFTWTTSKHVPFSDPILVDREQLGGIATENIQSPGYSNLEGIEVKSIRDEDTDSYRVRGRRVFVPVVLEPRAGIRITGTGV